MPGTQLKRYRTGSAQVNRTTCGCKCDSNEKMILFQSQEQCVNTQAEADQNTWGKHELSRKTSVHKSACFVLLQDYFL
jgi:hypothetical protein